MSEFKNYKDVQYFIGPMSKNIVDVVIEYCNVNNKRIGLIPSRRQVDYNGGYSNNWNTKEFSNYVRSLSKNVILQRDHGGPSQGFIDDDGYDSLREDCKYFDLIHIDPWKKFKDFKRGVEETVLLIDFCYNQNPNIEFEVGTEESIRKFDSDELSGFMELLMTYLPPDKFSKIKYLVIQSGTSLMGNNQTGIYNVDRLEKMLNVCKKFNVLSKEHNGDYISKFLINEKFNIGLNSINIAPEFGLIETHTYLSCIEDESIFEDYFQICYKSDKWRKWVDENFNPLVNKLEIIRVCGHYVLSDIEFQTKIKSKFKDIDELVKINIFKKLDELYG